MELTKYEKLRQEAADNGLYVDEVDFKGNNLKGLYCNGSIAIKKGMTTAESACVLSEELGHHYTSSGNILDMKDSGSRKQEYKARLNAYNRSIGLIGIISASKAGCSSRYEIAEHLGVTESALDDAVNAYRGKYGSYTIVDNYMVIFIPNLRVYEYLDVAQ